MTRAIVVSFAAAIAPATAAAQPRTAAPSPAPPAAASAEPAPPPAPDAFVVALVRGGAALWARESGQALVEVPERFTTDGDAFTLSYDADDHASTVTLRGRRTETGTVAVAATVARVSTAFRSVDVAPEAIERALADALADAFAEAEPPPPVIPAAPPAPTRAPPAPAPPPPAEVEMPAPAEAPRDVSGPFGEASLGVSGPFGSSSISFTQGVGGTAVVGYAFGSRLALDIFVEYASLSVELAGDGYYGYGSASDVNDASGSVTFAGAELRAFTGAEDVRGWAGLGLAFGSGSIDVSADFGDTTIEFELDTGASIAVGGDIRFSEGIRLGAVLRWFPLSLDSFCAEVGGDRECITDVDSIEFPHFLFFGATLAFGAG